MGKQFVFEYPYLLLFIPLLAVLIFFARRMIFPVSSSGLFDIFPHSLWQRFWLKFFWALPPFLLFAGMAIGFLALAEPKSRSSFLVEKPVAARVAVLIDDVSGSTAMGVTAEKTRMDVLKVANEAFLEEFCRRSSDDPVKAYVGLVIFDDTASVRTVPTRDCNIVRRRVKMLYPRGLTAIEKGLWTGLVLLLEFADKGTLIEAGELKKIERSLKERYPVLPVRREEFCKKYQGLSLELFTDGDFPSWAKDRVSALESTAVKTAGKSASFEINPFHVIDIAHSLCIRTYFWSVEQILPAYQAAFSIPPELGKAMLVKDMDPRKLAMLYKDVAKKEAGKIVLSEEIVFNPLKAALIAIGFACFLSGSVLTYLKWFSRNTAGKERDK